MLSLCFLEFSVGVGVFVTGLSQISSCSSFFQTEKMFSLSYGNVFTSEV